VAELEKEINNKNETVLQREFEGKKKDEIIV
jgi:hypothetical protein